MKEIKESIKKVFGSKKVLIVVSIVGILVVFSFIFQAGVLVGFHKASFGKSWSENYERNFGMIRGEKEPFRRIGMPENFPNAHGTVGKIIKIELPSIITLDKDGTEKLVLINENTEIRSAKEKITKNDLKIDNFIVVIGSPNTQGQIEAKLIRVMPVPELLDIKNMPNEK
jgi:hypothetical protein